MSNIIEVKNLNFGYDDNKIFDNFNLNINKCEFVSLIGPDGSGKSTLIKILSGLLDFSGNIFINDLELTKNNLPEIRKSISLMMSNVDSELISEKVFDNIAFPLENLNVNKKEIYETVNSIANKLGIYELLDKSILNLNSYQKILVNLASCLVYKPKILILDEAFACLDRVECEKMLNLLKLLCDNGVLTVINVTQNMDDLVFSNSIIVLDNGNIALNDNKNEVFKMEKVFNKLGLDLPFMVDLSIKLKYYNLVDSIIYNMDEMVDVLWK